MEKEIIKRQSEKKNKMRMKESRTLIKSHAIKRMREECRRVSLVDVFVILINRWQ